MWSTGLWMKFEPLFGFYLKKKNITHRLPWRLWRSFLRLPYHKGFVIPLGDRSRVFGLLFLNLFDRVVALDIRFFFRYVFWLSVQQKKRTMGTVHVWPFKNCKYIILFLILFLNKVGYPLCKKNCAHRFPSFSFPSSSKLKRNNKKWNEKIAHTHIFCVRDVSFFFTNSQNSKCSVETSSLDMHCGHLALYLCDY